MRSMFGTRPLIRPFQGRGVFSFETSGFTRRYRISAFQARRRHIATDRRDAPDAIELVPVGDGSVMIVFVGFHPTLYYPSPLETRSEDVLI